MPPLLPRRILVATLATLAMLPGMTVVASLTGSTPVASAATAPSGESGVYRGGLAAPEVGSFETWRGRDVDRVHSFFPGETWADIEGPDWWMRYWGAKPYRDRMLVTVPLLPSAGGTTLRTGATGAYDTHFRTAATRLVAAGMGNAVLRIGHELNGSWTRWYAKTDPAAFVQYFRRVVTVIRSVSGAAFTFDWNVNNGNVGFDATLAWPGDAYVDYVGIDVYDLKWADATATPEERWRHLVESTGTNPQGLRFWADFATRHGKPLSYAEWGLVDRDASMGGGGGGGDNPYFVQQMKRWFDSHRTAFEVYFEKDAADGKHMLQGSLFPRASAAYRQLFGSGETSGTPEAPTPPAPVAPSTIRVSRTADRAASVALDGQQLAGRVYVFARPPAAVQEVRFHLDDPARARAPRQTERSAPYDLGGGTARAPRHLSTAGLSVGAHVLTVVFVGSDGVSRTATAGFTVVRALQVSPNIRMSRANVRIMAARYSLGHSGRAILVWRVGTASRAALPPSRSALER